MKTNKHILKAALAMAGLAVVSTSCQDWLTVYPQNQVVDEEFWEDKNDLEGVRYAAYKQMANTAEKLAMWGDLRSDNYQLWPVESMQKPENKTTQQKYREIRMGQIEKDSANTYFDWGSVYTTINFCNKVLQHGSEVLERDKQFTPSEWRQMRAEMVGLRALNYFYLIRAFKDVPYTTQVINNDAEAHSFGATNQLVVLDSLIADVESVKGQARNRFTKTADTKGSITNAALYAMLSDMYLWRASLHEGRGMMTDSVTVAQLGGQQVNHSVVGDYQLAADYADAAMKNIADQLTKQNGSYGMSSMYEQISYGLPNVNLYKNNFEGFNEGIIRTPYAHQAIFVEGNSDESIFELQFNASDSRKNTFVNSLFGSDTEHFLSASENSLQAAFGVGAGTAFFRDARVWISAQNKLQGQAMDLPQTCIFKWQNVSPGTPGSNSNVKGNQVSLSTSTSEYRNWIIYRMSDVMLQKAEALVCINRIAKDANKLDEAMRLVHALHRRWYCNDNNQGANGIQPSEDVSTVKATNWGNINATTADATFGNLPKPSNVQKGTDEYEVGVMNERQLEFIAEGKRWFDLVRFAERHAGGQDGTQDVREYSTENPVGNGRAGVDLMIDQFLKSEYQDAAEILKTRFRDRYGLYNIIYYMEIKASEGKLEQNPVWNKSTYDK